jgi:hypothetical protein
MAEEKNNAEVISVFPNKVRIAVYDMEKFKVKGELLTVGSYLKVFDQNECSIIAIIENYSIELKEAADGTRSKVYIIEAMPLGYIDADGIFQRGGNNIAIPPKTVEPAEKSDIQKIYDDIEKSNRFCFSKLGQDKSVCVPVDGNKFFNKHIAIVGSTGSGKSYSLAKIIQEAIESKDGEYQGLNNSHIVIFDIHSEYKAAFPGKESNNIDVSSLILPYWLLSSEELEDLFIESNEEQSHNQIAILKKAVIDSKRKYYSGNAAEKLKIHYDSPVFFDIDEVMQVIREKNEEMIPGVRDKKQGPLFGKLDNFITRLENKINDSRLDFLLGKNTKSIKTEDVLRQFISYIKDDESNITIIDLSGVPFDVLSITVSLISRILFDYAYSYKKINPLSINETPILMVYEEAHKYVPKSGSVKFNASRYAIERIAKEGRKYGITLVIVSQRPSEVSETIFSQCSNFVAMRLTNPDDQNYVRRLLPDTLGPLTESLPTLQAGEALLIGDSVVMPSLVKIDKCSNSPASNDIRYLEEWKKEWKNVDFLPLIEKMIKK